VFASVVQGDADTFNKIAAL